MINYFKQSALTKLMIQSVFGTEAYLKTQSEIYGGISSDNIKLTFYLKSALGINWCTFTSVKTNDTLTEENYNKEIEEILFYLKSKKSIAFITCPPSYLIFPFPYKKGENAEFGTVKINLKNSEEDIFKDLHGKHRNVIRKAEKDGLKVEFGKHLQQTCYKLIQETLKRENVFFESLDEFNRICEALKEQVQFFVVKKDTQVQGVAVIPFDSNDAYYLWGGSIKGTSAGAMNFMHWKVIQYFKEKGVLNYDFVGVRLNPAKDSKLNGLKRFKTRFGGNVEKGHLWKVSLKPIPTLVFNLLYLIKTRSKPSDIIESIINSK